MIKTFQKRLFIFLPSAFLISFFASFYTLSFLAKNSAGTTLKTRSSASAQTVLANEENYNNVSNIYSEGEIIKAKYIDTYISDDITQLCFIYKKDIIGEKK